MSEQGNQDDNKSPKSNQDDRISIIYHQKNDSPKYFEIKRSKIYWFFIGLPTITLIALAIGVVGFIHTSPFHLIENYRKSKEAGKLISRQEMLEDQVQSTLEENEELKAKISELKKEIISKPALPNEVKNESETTTDSSKGLSCPAAPPCPVPGTTATVNSIGLSTLSFFKPIQGQRDRTRPASLNLSGFKVVTSRDSVNFQFNIIPSTENGEAKISGHIIVLMKNELGIQAYPIGAFGGNDYQINYSAGETFATQRFRPVDAGFIKPRKSGNYIFTVFIFSRTGDLLHYQTVTLPVRI